VPEGPPRSNPLELTGKRILITGASSGIGRATACLASRSGAALVLVGRNLARLTETRHLLEGEGHSLQPFDLTAVDDIPALLQEVAADGGPLWGVFHAAGVAHFQSVGVLTESRVESVLGLSVTAALLLARGACQRSVRAPNGGSLVFMSSVAGLRGGAGMAAYSAGKAGVDGMVRSLACELAPLGVRVNSIAAGAVQTEMHDSIIGNLGPEGTERYRAHHLLGFGEAEDVAHAAVFLLSDAARWITGTTLVVDGGYSCH